LVVVVSPSLFHRQPDLKAWLKIYQRKTTKLKRKGLTWPRSFGRAQGKRWIVERG
jgi:hypothetical protein